MTPSANCFPDRRIVEANIGHLGIVHTAAQRSRRLIAGILTVVAAALAAPSTAAQAAAPASRADAPPPPGASLTLDGRHDAGGGRIPPYFVGLSIEWSLIERYMNPVARPVFANLLANLRTGVLRIGGASQDLMPFDPVAPNTPRVITPEDLASIRATLDAVNARRDSGDDPSGPPASWGVILGTALAPPSPERPWVGPDHARRFADAVEQVFAGRARRSVVSIGLGNEPDISYRFDLASYMADLQADLVAEVTRPFAIDVPSTSETIAPWQSIAARTVPTRWFWDWPAILDAIAPATKAVRASVGLNTTDHFYPTARGCANDDYRCASIDRLLSEDRMANLAYLVNTHASEAAQRGLAYRLGELNSAAGRGVEGVSDVAASALWALDAMFTAACPQPPDVPGGERGCGTGAIGVNFHNAEVQQFFAPEQGNAFYNAIDYDPSPAAGAPAPAPEYYALLLFAHFAQDSGGWRPLPVAGAQPAATTPIKAWSGADEAGRPTLFLINKSALATTVDIRMPGSSSVELHRMTPYDPTGAGRTLDAPQVLVDGRSVAPDGTWPGFVPVPARTTAGKPLRIAVGAGETIVLTPR